MSTGIHIKRLCSAFAKMALFGFISAQLSGCIFAAAAGASAGVYGVQHYKVKVSKKKSTSKD